MVYPSSAAFCEGGPALDGGRMALGGPHDRPLPDLPALLSRRLAWSRWQHTPKVCSITWASGDAVHTSPRNPFASAPRASNAGICARCSAPQTLADGGTTDAQRAGDVFLPPGPLVQLPGPLPSLLLRIHFGASRRCRR